MFYVKLSRKRPDFEKLSRHGRAWTRTFYSSLGSYKTDPRILIFSIVMGADYSFVLTLIETYAPNLLDIINCY